MKRVAIGVALGAAAGLLGVIVYELTNQQIAGWLTTSFLLGVVTQLPPRTRGNWLWWGMLGGGMILANWLLGQVVQYPILTAWPLLGALFGYLAPAHGLGRRIGGCLLGLMAGLLGMGILPLLTQVLLPMLNLPTTFDYDVDVLGLVMAGVFIGGTTAWLKGDGVKNTKKGKRRISVRGKKR